MSEENKNRCPRCNKGKLKTLKYHATESDGRKWHSINAKICRLYNTIFSNGVEMNFHNGYQKR